MQNIKTDIEELKVLVNSKELTNEEKRIIKKLLNYIRLNVKLSIFHKVISNKDEITELIASIDNLISNYEQTLNNSIEDIGYSFKIKRLKAMRESILANDYEYFVQDIIKDFQDEQELIDMCSLSLSSDYQRFETYFGKPIVTNEGRGIHGYKVDEETIDCIFDIIMNRSLNKSINDYVLTLKGSQKFDFKLQQLRNRRKLFEKCIENHDLLEGFIKVLMELVKVDDEYKDFENTYIRNKNVIEVIDSGSFVERLSKKYEKAKRIEENEIIDKNYLQVKNARIESLEETRNELFEKLAAVGLEFVLVQLQNKIKIENSKIVYDYSSKNVDNYEHVAYTLYNELIDDLYSIILEEKQKYLNKKDDIYSKMDITGKSLIDKHLSDCIKISELENSSRRYCVSPMLSAFMLRVISKLKHIDFEKLSETFLKESDENSLKKDYDEFINRKIGEIYDQISRLKADDVPINNL